ncbi:hypothetical protein SAMN05660473_00179 [Arthrobacter sp. 49Tsu3.1M3]|uniref:hypothetical protein n=1 Tax=Arthrobacter sp. 49Tsu3.1M3 TaxID=1279029 RepID=UPI0009A7BD4B|nr:hypothetical protein [Arthrobacter sp. 49Tsu3.1M3]SKB33826.1 hypothetical protein SAMN05660473_00179 [Arthrobacter sp. 49Tsu3.1M3]
MKRALIPIALAVGVGLFAGTGAAVAAPPTPLDPTAETLDCPGFTVEAVTTGKTKVIDQFPHHLVDPSKDLRFYTNVGADVTITLTGPTSKMVRYPLNGTIQVALGPTDFVYKGTGKNLISLPAGSGAPGIFYTSGQVTWTLNGPVSPNGGLTGPGKVTDVCALLAP